MPIEQDLITAWVQAHGELIEKLMQAPPGKIEVIENMFADEQKEAAEQTNKVSGQKPDTAAPRRMKLKDFIELHPQLPGKVTAVWREREQVDVNKKADE